MSTRDVLLGDRRRRCSATTPGLSSTPTSVHARLVLVVGHARDDDAPRAPGPPRSTHVPGCVGERAADVHRDAVLHRDLHAPDLKHLRAERRELEHLLVRDAVDLRGPTGRRSGRSCRRRRRRCRSRTRRRRWPPRPPPRSCPIPPRPSVVMLPCSSTPWKPATTAISPRSTVSKIFEPVDRLDARLGERAVGQDLHLVAEERARLARPRPGWPCAVSAAATCSPGGGDRVHLARVGDLRDLVGEREQAVRLAAHGAHDDDDVVARRAAWRGTRRATFRMRSIEPTEVPPNFWTTRATAARDVQPQTRHGESRACRVNVDGSAPSAAVVPSHERYAGYLLETLVTLVAVCAAGVRRPLRGAAARHGARRAGRSSSRGHAPARRAARNRTSCASARRSSSWASSEAGFTKLGELAGVELPGAGGRAGAAFAEVLARAAWRGRDASRQREPRDAEARTISRRARSRSSSRWRSCRSCPSRS